MSPSWVRCKIHEPNSQLCVCVYACIFIYVYICVVYSSCDLPLTVSMCMCVWMCVQQQRTALIRRLSSFNSTNRRQMLEFASLTHIHTLAHSHIATAFSNWIYWTKCLVSVTYYSYSHTKYSSFNWTKTNNKDIYKFINIDRVVMPNEMRDYIDRRCIPHRRCRRRQ